MNNMLFKDLTAHEKAMQTYQDIQERRKLKEKGKREALDHLYENTYRIRKALNGIKKSRKPRW
jgi:hypothetical protein